MKDFSTTTVLLSTTLCVVAMLNNPASATKMNEKASVSNPTYTSNGKMDKKTAIMLINLLRNPHLQVRASVNGQPLQTISPQTAAASMSRPTNVLVNYTITGKTSRANVLKLKRLMQNSKHISISAHANIRSNPQRMANTQRFQNQFITGYTPFYSNVTPPTYIQGNVVWMPIPINNPVTALPNYSTEMFARN